MNLRWIPGRYGVARLAQNADLPGWFIGPGFAAMVRASDELTLVCDEARIPSDATAELGWACFRSVGPFAFDEAGVVAALVSPISTAGIGVFVLCTFDGEHILCPAGEIQNVQSILESVGHVFVA